MEQDIILIIKLCINNICGDGTYQKPLLA